MLELILKGGAAERINAKMVELEQHKKQLQETVAGAGEAPPLLHPEMASYYRRQVAQLHVALVEGDDTDRTEAREILRSLIEAIILTPDEVGGLTIDLRGDLAAILTIAAAQKAKKARFVAAQTKKPPRGAALHATWRRKLRWLRGQDLNL